MKRTSITTTIVLSLSLATGFAQKNLSVSPPAADNSPEAELASFEIAEGYEVSLFASEKDGIANPIAMRWGPRGRLWVLCTLVYPQIVPTEAPSDKLLILEDRDRDGRADHTVVFADNLDMPTGFALGDGGVYVGQGDDLIFLRDTNGDDRADQSEMLFTGFGTGDTHQNINSFTWSPDGELLFLQGLHNFARVETPWGIVRLDEHGAWRLRPKRRQLHTFPEASGQNPWGIAFGHWGEPFVKGNGNSLSEFLPLMIHTTHRHRPLDIGGTRIKSMICEIVDSPAMPEDLQGDILIAGYFGHLIDRLKITTDGSGHRGVLQEPIIRSKHPSFRPVDIQTGPDGTIYIADWYNPIIGHYQASLRHPHRDKAHGRIWRLTAKGHKPIKNPVRYDTLPASVILQQLLKAPLKERERLRIILSNDTKPGVHEISLRNWVGRFDPKDPDYDHHLYEGLAQFAWHEIVDRELLEKTLSAKHPLARAYATRIVGRWHDRLEKPLSYLERSIADPHPRVRLEAVVAASYLKDPAAMSVATRALDSPMDRFLHAALVQCTHALKDIWMPALQNNQVTWNNPDHLAFVLTQSSGKNAATAARQALQSASGASQIALQTVLARHGSLDDLNSLMADPQLLARHPVILRAIIDSARIRGTKSNRAGLGKLLTSLIDDAPEEVGILALELNTLWKIPEVNVLTLVLGTNSDTPIKVRLAALKSLAHFKVGGNQQLAILQSLTKRNPRPEIRAAALLALSAHDLGGSAIIAAAQLSDRASAPSVRDLLLPFLTHQAGLAALAKAVAGTKISPTTAGEIHAALGAAGRTSPELLAALPKPTAESIGLPAYSEQLVAKLAAEVRNNGNANAGSKVYHRAALSCVTCHAINDKGGTLGPDLTAVGAGVPIEILIESILWPRRQIKEGYLSTTITTKAGQVLSGHLRTENKERIVIHDAASQSDHTLSPRSVASRQDAGSIMPPGLTAHLTREELRDLIRFLADLKK